jgi:hypothetical protein
MDDRCSIGGQRTMSDFPKLDPITLWTFDVNDKLHALEDRMTGCEKYFHQIDRISGRLMRLEAKGFERGPEQTKVIQKLERGELSVITEYTYFTGEECDLLLNMLGIEERLT